MAEEHFIHDREREEKVQNNKVSRSSDSEGIPPEDCTTEVVDHTEDNGREVSGEMDSLGYPIRHKGGGKIREKHQKTFLRHNQGNNA